MDVPILEFDPERQAIIEPSRVVRPIQIPERCGLPYYASVFAALASASRLTHVAQVDTVLGSLPVYTMEHEGSPLTVAHPGLCAPLAAAVLEELIALGCRTFIACGGAGVLDRSLVRGTVVVPTSAVRDEGVSYHYLPPSRELPVDPEVVASIVATLERQGVPHRLGKTWTTDAVYRETPVKIARRRGEGCVAVEMECAALLAVAKFRGVRFGQILATGDDVSGSEWDPRDGPHPAFSERLFWLAVEACLSL